MVAANTIIAQIESKHAGDRAPRRRLGLSEIGHSCPRLLWYKHHGYEQTPPSGRILRLFRLGDIIEDAVIADLNAIGMTVTRRQEEISVTDRGITLIGHIDGAVNKMLLEIKSANDKSFKHLVMVGYEKWQPKYKAQIHVYMALGNFDKCLVIVENKNDSTLYAEIIKADPDYATKILIDVFDAITRPDPPPRMCPDKTWYEAKFCDFREVCFSK